MPRFLIPATFILAISQLASRALGVVRDHLFAQIFGATTGTGIFQLDTYYAAFRLPDLVYNLLIFGTLSAAFIPLISELKDREKENQFASNVLNVLFICVLILSAGVFIFAEPLTQLITPGFSSEQIIQTAELLRIQLLAPLAFTLAAVFGGLAQHFHRFFWYALAPVVYNLGIIGGAVFWGAEFGVYGLAWGTALGAGLFAVIELPGILRRLPTGQQGFRWRAIFSPSRLWPLFRLAIPRIISVGANQFQFITITIFASLVGSGSLAIFNYSWNLASLPFGVVGLAFATASFAALSRLADKPTEFAEKLRTSLAGILFWVMPAAIGLFILRTDIVRLILAGGAFTETDITLVSQSVAVLAVSVPFLSLLPVLNNAFFAQKNTKIPLLAALTFLGLTILGANLLTPSLKEVGLAASFAIATIVGVLLLLGLLYRRFTLRLGDSLLRILIASTALGGLVFKLADLWVVTLFSELALKVGVLSIGGGLFYLVVARLLGLNLRKF